jgi:Arc/MetJ-type ribon-helix-helix transcriptional regulator
MAAPESDKFEEPRVEAKLRRLLTLHHELSTTSPELRQRMEQILRPPDNVRPLGHARKISLSMPEDLTAAVQQRVGRGQFSQYVTEAVAKQLELDLIAELSDLLEADHGSLSDEMLAEADAAWPDR